MNTRNVIIKNISDKCDISLKEAKNINESFLCFLKKNAKIRKVKLPGFGVFYMHITPERTGRNPKTKDSYIIQPMKKIIFKPSKKVKQLIN